MAYYKKGGQMDLSDRIAIETGICNKDSFKKIAKQLHMRSKKIVLSFDDLKNGRGIEYGDGFKFYDLDEKSIIKRLEEFIMTVVLTIVLTIGVNYLLGHWNEIVYSNRTSRKGYHTDHDAVLRDLALKGKNETLRKFNKGCYDVKDKE